MSPETVSDDAEREKLLAAARQVLDRSGWWGFKVQGVLTQARLSTRSFYRHFEKKSDLVLALLEQELSRATVHIERIVTASNTPSDRVRAFIAATIDLAYRQESARPSSMFAAHWRELLPEYPDAIERVIGKMIEPLVQALGDGMATGEFTSTDPVADAEAIFHLVSSMTADQAAQGGLKPREDIEHIVVPFVSRAIGLA